MKQITEEQVQEAIAYGISEKDARRDTILPVVHTATALRILSV